MTYDPDRRYAHDLEARDFAKALPEDVAEQRGQFWNVDRSMRGRWTGAGAALGFAIIRALYDSDVLNVLRPLPGMNMTWSLISTHAFSIVAGGVLGYLAASIVRRIRRGLRT
jgi:hypothetical protein